MEKENKDKFETITIVVMILALIAGWCNRNEDNTPMHKHHPRLRFEPDLRDQPSPTPNPEFIKV